MLPNSAANASACPRSSNSATTDDVPCRGRHGGTPPLDIANDVLQAAKERASRLPSTADALRGPTAGRNYRVIPAGKARSSLVRMAAEAAEAEVAEVAAALARAAPPDSLRVART